MKIDVFNHFTPRSVYERFKSIAPDNPGLKAFGALPALWDLEARLKLMEGFDGYQQILSLANPPIELLAAPDQSPQLAALANDALAEVCARHRHSFPAFVASMPMNNPGAAIREAERAITTLGARGVQVFSNVNGKPLSNPEFLPLFEFMARHDLPVWIHPMRGPHFSDYATEDHSENEIWFTFGWPYETSACVTRLIFSGLFDRLPGLKIITHHLGAMVPFLEARVGLSFADSWTGVFHHLDTLDDG